MSSQSMQDPLLLHSDLPHTAPAQSPYIKTYTSRLFTSQQIKHTHAKCQIEYDSVSIKMTIIIAVYRRKLGIRYSPFANARRQCVRSIFHFIRDSHALSWPEPDADTLAGGFLHDVPASVGCVECVTVGPWRLGTGATALVAYYWCIAVGRDREPIGISEI